MANGNFGGGDGTIHSPYLVEDAYDLDAIRNSPNSYYAQVKDIDLSSFGLWEPINKDSTSNPPTIRYDGCGHIIKNLKVNISTGYGGLFGAIDYNSTIKSLGIVNCEVFSDSNNCGAFFGYSVGVLGDYQEYVTLKNCYSTGKVSGLDNVGGLGGNFSSNNEYKLAENCWSSCEVVGKNRIGGLFGNISNRSTVKNCFALNPSVTTIDPSGTTTIGDIHGSGSGSVVNCYSLDSIIFAQN